MKRCPECRRDYYDDTLLYCLDDGSALLEGPATMDEPATAILSEPPAVGDGLTQGDALTRPQIDSGNKTANDLNGASITQRPSSAEYIVGEVKKHRLAWLAAAVLFVLGLGGVGYLTLPRTAPINSIAVLPFINDSGNADTEYLSDGLSENLINNLSRLRQLKVIARSSSFRFRGENVDIQDAAQKLGVGAVLTGRIIQRGEDLQISVELIDTADNTRIWGDVYNRKVSTAMNVSEEIAQAVSEKLQLKLSGAQEQQMAKHLTQNPKAYQSYMNGVFFRRKNGAENIRKALEYQNQAVELDPNFARAFAELSINFAALVEIAELSPKEGMPQARAAAEKALALDETLAEAHYTLARVRHFEFDWSGAETAYQKAIELNPNLAAAHTLYAEYLSHLGRFDEALREIRLAQVLDPLRTGLVGNEGSIFYLARQYDEAVTKARIHVSAAPENPFAHLNLANALVEKGQHAEALGSFQASLKLEETTSALLFLARAHAATGNRNDALGILERLQTTKKYVSPAETAILYAALGERQKAFDSLEKAFAERDFRLTSLKIEMGYDPLRDDPRFTEMLNRLNLPE